MAMAHGTSWPTDSTVRRPTSSGSSERARLRPVRSSASAVRRRRSLAFSEEFGVADGDGGLGGEAVQQIRVLGGDLERTLTIERDDRQ
jgi:hypothetical protein